ncbi:RNA polymerase sigma factor [Wenzhouxiangella marina]|uniref:ECF subfamily RNA polymerase sigma-24 factor n=1 Tax=Wenzhouxiangella marina TaxID=1579979 RepID=A0A0K0XS58_9GAMM|nr:sigma-70 family RNA polymerase sigma factor [Wenzhouxiangella marina]AKS40490.1 ECF subfamily RNA polymerase sigma-24 factor [Wenzhouxiangella marina]MBB6088188.1 RNA polymerase sigma-70 factor (ECF subfamily) [Wenzhouxiangella marina]
MALSVEAFERSYRSLERALFNYLYRWVWDAQGAQDLIHDAFERLWRKRESLDPDGFEALVWTTVINLARNRWRRQRLLQWLPYDQAASEEPTPDRALAELERERMIRRALGKLSRKHREVLLLALYSRLDREEQARALGIAPGTLASRKHAATQRMHALLKETFDD